MSIMTVVLAAGASSRMGSPKALLDLDGATFVTRIVTTARAAGTNVVVVVGPPDGDKVKAKLPVGAAPVWNHDPSRGMLSSVQSAIQALPPRTAGILVWPVDLPKVSQETVRRILDAPLGRIVIPRHNGKGGHPVRIPSKFFGAIAGLAPEAGLHAFTDGHKADVLQLDVDDAAVVQDIDTPEEHAAAKGDKGARKAH